MRTLSYSPITIITIIILLTFSSTLLIHNVVAVIDPDEITDNNNNNNKRAIGSLDFTDSKRDYYPLLNKQEEDPPQMLELAFDTPTTPSVPSDPPQLSSSDSSSDSEITDNLPTQTQSSPEQVPSVMSYGITGSAETLRTEKGNVGMVALAVTIFTLVFW